VERDLLSERTLNYQFMLHIGLS